MDEETLARIAGSTFRRKMGCPRCGNTNYKGRIGVFQLLEMTRAGAARVGAGAARGDRARAQADGMRSLWYDGVAKVAARDHDGRGAGPVCTV